MNRTRNSAASIVRLRQRDRVIVPVRADIDQLVPVIASGALEEAANLIDFRLNGGKEDFQPTFSAFPHGGLRRVNAHHSAALAAQVQQQGEDMTRKREYIASEDISDLPPPSHRHPMSGEPIWDQHAVRAMLRAPVAALKWSDVAEPNEQIRYAHVLADSPLGRFSIEWKSWKPHDTFCVYLDGDYLDTSMNLDDAKAVALKKISDMARALAGFAALASAPVAREAQPSDVEIIATFAAAGINTDTTLNGLYTVRGQSAQLINGARALLARYAAPQASEAVPNLPRGWQLALNLAIDAIENAAPAGQDWPVNWPAIVHGLKELRDSLAQPQASEAVPAGVINAARWAGFSFLRHADGSYTMQQLATATAQASEVVQAITFDADRLRAIASSGSQTAMSNALLNVARALSAQPGAQKEQSDV